MAILNHDLHTILSIREHPLSFELTKLLFEALHTFQSSF